VSLIDSLHDAMVHRRIESGKQLLSQNDLWLRAIAPGDPGAPRLLYVLAAWAEYLPAAAEIALALDAAYREKAWPDMSLRDWSFILAGQASLALFQNHRSEIDAAWQWVRDNASRFGADAGLLATLDFTKARIEKRNALYPSALELVKSAIARYSQAGLPGMVAVAHGTEGWLLMQLGCAPEALAAWEAAQGYLQGTEDWTVLGNIRFSQARHLCHRDQQVEARSALREAAELYSRCQPPHRNLRRVFLESANLDLRMASAERDSSRAKGLRDSAGGLIVQAEELLKNDKLDTRNHGRLLLARVNQILSGPNPSLLKARNLGQEACDLAERCDDKIIKARALYKQARIEAEAAEFADDPPRLRLLACRYAIEALELAQRFHNHRLLARLHTFLGGLYLEFPFHDKTYATQECDAAALCMVPHHDSDYVVKRIDDLARRIKEPGTHSPSETIITIAADPALTEPLASTIEHVERAIVLKAVECFNGSPNALAVSKALDMNRHTVTRYRDEPRSLPKYSSNGDVIFRVTASMAFTQPLQRTTDAVERAIIRCAWIRNDCNQNKTKKDLHINTDRFQKAFAEPDAATALRRWPWYLAPQQRRRTDTDS
jgi:hypothetical protein